MRIMLFSVLIASLLTVAPPLHAAEKPNLVLLLIDALLKLPDHLTQLSGIIGAANHS